MRQEAYKGGAAGTLLRAGVGKGKEISAATMGLQDWSGEDTVSHHTRGGFRLREKARSGDILAVFAEC